MAGFGGLLGKAAGATVGGGAGQLGASLGNRQYKGPGIKGPGTPGFTVPAMDMTLKGGGPGTTLTKPPADMQNQGRTAPDLNSKMGQVGEGLALGAARLLGRRGSSF